MKIPQIHRAVFVFLVLAIGVRATEFHGVITDSKTALPIDSVKVVFSFNYEPQTPVYTNSAGSFWAHVPLDGQTNVQFSLSKNGYSEKTNNLGSHMNVTDTFNYSTTLVPSPLVAVQGQPARGSVAMGNGTRVPFSVDGRRATVPPGQGRTGSEASDRAAQVILKAGPRLNLSTRP